MSIITKIGEFRNHRDQLRKPKDAIFTLAVLPSQTIVVGDSHGTLGIWSYEAQVQNQQTEQIVAPQRLRKIIGHSHTIDCTVVIDPSLRILASGSQGDLTSIRVWNLNEGLCLSTLKGHKSTISCLVTLNQGRWIASGSFDGTIKVWDWKRGEQEFELEGHGYPVLSLTKNSEQTYLISGGDDYKIKIWQIETCNCVSIISQHYGSVHSLSFLGNGRFASGSASGQLYVWELERALIDCGAAQPSIKLLGHKQTVTSIAKLQNQSWLVSVSEDRSLKLWDFASGLLLQDLVMAHEDVITCVVQSSEEKCIYSGDWKGLIKKWAVNS